MTTLNPKARTQIAVRNVQAACDDLDDIVDNLNFPVINRLDIKHRAALSEQIVSQSLPPEGRAALDELASGRSKWAFFSNKWLPHDGSYETTVSLQMGLIKCAKARPFGYLEGDGSVARLVAPKEGHENSLTTAGRQQFDAHIDHAWARFPWEPDDGRPVMPDFLCLGGHINPHCVATAFADPLDIVPNLPDLTRYVLEQPEWSLPAPSSVSPALIATRLPLVTRGPDRLPVIRLNPRIVCETHRAREALAVLESTMANPKFWTEIVLGTGDIVLAKGTALHKRGAVTGPRELAAIYGRHVSTASRVLSAANTHLEPVH